MKALPKSLREKKRYVSFEIISENSVSFEEFKKAYTLTIKELVGMLGLAKTSLMVVKDQYKYPTGIIKTNTKSLKIIQAAFAYMKELNKQPIQVRSIKTSGLIHKLTEK